MVKAKGMTKDNKPCLFLGVCEANIQRLKEGMPIHINDSTFYDGQIVILYGKTEEDIAELFKDRITDDTIIRDDKSKHMNDI